MKYFQVKLLIIRADASTKILLSCLWTNTYVCIEKNNAYTSINRCQAFLCVFVCDANARMLKQSKHWHISSEFITLAMEMLAFQLQNSIEMQPNKNAESFVLR